MKTKSFTIALAMIVLASASLMATDLTPSLEVKNEKGSSIYKVVYKAAGQGKVSMKISAKDGGVLYSEVLNYTDAFTYPLDFNGMKNGEYTVEISNKKTKLKKTVVYDVKSPSAYVRIAKQPEEKYMLTIASQVPANFTVRIYDRWNREVLTKNESVSGTFGLVYNLANVDGPFTFEVVESTGKLDVVKYLR
jgi:hypothetical protein